MCAQWNVLVCARAINSLLIYEYETTTTAALSEYINVHAFFFFKDIVVFSVSSYGNGFSSAAAIRIIYIISGLFCRLVFACMV